MTVTLVRKACLRLLGLALAMAPVGLSAAERLEAIVVTATREQQRLREVAGSISAVSSEEIELVGATHHSEIVNRAPGAMIQRNSGQESLTAIRSPVLSGPGSCGVFLFLENSIPIRPTGFCNVNELFEVHLEQAASIEVLRGPAGVVYGSGAMHGAINVIQPEPAQLPTRALAVEAGPDDYYRGKLALAHQGRNVDVGATLLAAHDGGWRASSGIEEQKLSAGLTKRFEESVLDLHLAITNLNQETAGFIEGFEAYRDEAIARSNPNPEAYRNAYAVRLSGRYAMPLGERVQLVVRPYARHSRMDFLQHFLIGKPLEENGQDSLGVLTTFDIRAFRDTRLLAGLDLEGAEGFLKETQAGPATDGPPAANLIRPAGKHYDYEVRSQVAALYGLLELPLTSQLRLTAGVRFEHVRYDYDNRMLSGNTRDDGTSCAPEGCLYHRPEDRTDEFSNVTSKLGLTYALSDAHTLYVSAARGYRAPDTSELYRLQRQQSIADLDAERLDSIELGVRGDFGSLSYSLAAFVMEKDNVIFRDSDAFNVSDGRTDHEGIEYEFVWLPVDTLSLALSGTYAEHTYDFDAMEGSELIVAGRVIDTAPRRIQNARLTWRFLPAATAELEWQSIGRYFLDASNEHEYGGHDLMNLRLGWDMARNWRTIVRVTNLTDRKYADRADFAFGNYRYFPGRDRSVFLELSYRSQ
ncbi:MAG TPA: TonB-dependent receptor [Steroidobacter sp.]